MFEIKICGVRLKSDIDAVRAACDGISSTHDASPNADAARRNHSVAVGLNFYPPSVRFIEPADPSSRSLSTAAQDAGLLRVGVFVNETAAAIQAVNSVVGLDAVQLHGDELIQTAIELIASGHSVIRAIKLPTVDLSVDLIEQRVAPWTEVGCHPLLDADAGAAHGGSGKTLDWSIVSAWAASHPDLAWTLAGGLNPDNVAAAITESTAKSIDTASGAEETRGIKSPSKIQAFFQAASRL
ncbi:N-(5'-phosphoribosyl)anthranilate isomerase [Planctomycetes bacterium K23_9]|uniref:N-(5'-phosphoribosyl)anthranilate isomerase n=1 Tax=Stieleria marina TaxID=1930275 RepID=A0A517NW39_9BACT|nr:N-(5'-phosphoribosyl)anthranilate isomerase [Planctomycetes bacterium K23_9]